MKKLCLLLVTGLMALNLFSQSEYETAIKSGLDLFYQSASIEEMQNSANQFDRIAEAESEKWLPRYYAAYVQTIMAFKIQEPEKKTKYIDAAQKQLNKALEIAPKESELHTLQGMVYQATIGIDPMKNGQIYSGKAAACFNTATAYNPGNPRPFYLQGVSVLHTPEQWGGGKKAAYPLLAKAASLYESFEPESTIAPNWGMEDCQKQLKACSEN
jgi:tetratricopeptide (TPR) repeat protein